MASVIERATIPEEFLSCLIRTVTDNPIYKLIGFIVAAFIPSIVAWFGPAPDPTIYAISILIVGHILISSGIRCKCYNEKYLKPGESRFEPFITSERRQALLPRSNDCRQLHEFAQEHSRKFILLVGRSGVGKSKLLQFLFPDFLNELRKGDTKPFSFMFIDNYGATVSKIIERLYISGLLNEQARNDALILFDQLRSEWSENDDQKPIARFAIGIERTLKPHLQVGNYYFAFDQAERVLMTGAGMDPCDRLGLTVLWEFLRSQRNVRVFIAVRSDLLFDCMDELSCITNKEASDEVLVFTLYGINGEGNPGEIATIRQRFTEILDIDPPLSLWSALGLNSKHTANTFVVQLFGYLLEKLRTNEWGDQRISKMMVRPFLSPTEIISIFMEYLLDEYIRISGSFSAKSILGRVLYTIAVDNRSNAEGCDVERIARLSHTPEKEVRAATEFLAQKRVLRGSVQNIWLTHDLVSSYIVSSNLFALPSDFRDSVRALAERKVDPKELQSPPNRTVPFSISSIFQPGSHFHWPIVVMILFCYVRSVFPGALFLFPPVHWWNNIIGAHFPELIDSFGFSGWYYLPIMLAYLAWVSFIYDLYQGYFQYILDKDAKWIRFLAWATTPIGVMCVVLVGFTPILFPIPIIICGLFMGVVLCAHARSTVGTLRVTLLGWGLKTAANMVFVSMIIPLTYVVVTGCQKWSCVGTTSTLSHGGVFVLSYFWLAGTVLVWFWAHIYKQQGSPAAWSTRLVMHDRGTVLVD